MINRQLEVLRDPKKRMQIIIEVLVFILADVVLAAFYHFDGNFGYVDVMYARFAFYNIPFILLTGLYGIVPSVFMLLSLFIYTLLSNMQQAYLFFPYLLAAFAIYLPARFRWFRKPRMVPIAIALLALILGNGYFFVIAFANPIGFMYITSFGQLTLFLSELPECIISMLLLWVFYNKSPEDMRFRFACAKFYTKEYERKLAEGTVEKPSAMGTHALLILIINLVILVSSSIAITMNMFDLYAVSAGTVSDTILPTDPDTKNWKSRVKEDINEGIREVKEIDESAISIPDQRFIIHMRQTYREGMSVDITSNSMLRQLSMMLIMIIVPMLIISNYILQRYLIVPITNMEKFMTGYVATDETKRKEYIENSPDITPPVHSELYQLHNALQILVRDVESYIETIQQQRTVEDNLRIQRLAAEAKSAFLANMSNQIRSPINSIMGMNTMIYNSTQEVETKAFSQDIRCAAQTLMSVVNDILDYAKIESGMLKIVPVHYDLHTTIRTVHSMVASDATDKELELIYEIDNKLPSMLIGDEIRIRQCILNIMTNAVKYTKEGSVTLSIRSERAGAHEVYLNVSVVDTGVGMTEEQVQQMLKLMMVGDDAMTPDAKSAGLGMTIVNYLLDTMGSHLYIRSSLGEGTEFRFRLLQKVAEWTPGEPFSLKRR